MYYFEKMFIQMFIQMVSNLAHLRCVDTRLHMQRVKVMKQIFETKESDISVVR